ncbi:MAG: hybrid sensor histidine kinase/response regulator [Chitinophagaceae bacterium]|nr:MAG: hybrid sensor histidine kinase/response regulator [Chitinophagaceae bacterium]
MKKKILLVDDREDNILSMESILAPEGYELVKATSGRQALRTLLNEFDFALILMDVEMPNLNGFETAELIYQREKLKHIPIVFITAHDYGEESMYKGYRSGAVDYLYKPVNPELLRAKVSVFIDLYETNRKLVAQEQKLIAINKSLENEIKERQLSEQKVKELNKELLDNVDHLEGVNRNLDRFAFMSSHDLQEPLRKIRTFSDLLYSTYKTVLDDDGVRYISRIQNAAERMQQLIKDILEFSKVGYDENAFEITDMNVLISEVVDDLASTVSEKEAQIEIGPIPALEVKPGLMRAVFSNLIENALKYAKPAIPPHIKIYAAETEQPPLPQNETTHQVPAKYCRIFVEDNGIGFDQKYADQIFEMFVRLHGRSQYEGTGIGLALCKQIIDKHQGYISALSKENSGSTFIVSLPVK